MNGDSDTSASTSNSHNEDPDEPAPKRAAPGTLRKTSRICTAEEGRTCLEDAQLIEPGEALDLDVLASALYQISFFQGMLQATRDSVRTVALLMAKAVPADAGEDVIGGIVDRVVDKLSGAVKAATQAAVAEIKSTSTMLMESSTQMAAMATSYHDVLKSTATSQATMTPSLDARVHVREGIKARQVLVDALTPDQQLHQAASNAQLVTLANEALHRAERPLAHRFIGIRQLNNGGLLLEMDSEAAALWLSQPDNRADFLG